MVLAKDLFYIHVYRCIHVYMYLLQNNMVLPVKSVRGLTGIAMAVSLVPRPRKASSLGTRPYGSMLSLHNDIYAQV